MVVFDDAVGHLAEYGYAVVEGAVPGEMCDAVVAAIESELGVSPTDPASWDLVSAEIDQIPLWNHPTQWEIRQLPHLYELWRKLFGTDDLWVDMNSCRFSPPWNEERADALPIHFDVDPRDPSEHWYPATIALTDAGPGEGGFRCVPSVFQTATWDAIPLLRATDGEFWPDVSDHEIIEVPLAKGDLVVFSTHLPHGTVRNMSDRPRIAFYMQMHIAGTPAEGQQRVEDVQVGRCPEWWRWKPGHDRLDPQTPSLSPLGQRLLGQGHPARPSTP